MHWDGALSLIGLLLVRIRLIFGLLLAVLACGLPPPPAEFRREVSDRWSEDGETDAFGRQLVEVFAEEEEVDGVEEAETVGDIDETFWMDTTTTNEEAPEVFFFFSFYDKNEPNL